VLTSINLNYNIFFEADKIDDIIPDRLLPPELHSKKLSSSEMSPDYSFCFG